MNSTSTVVATVASVIVVGLLCSTLREQRGWITGEWRATPEGRRAKYYQLTPASRARLKHEHALWDRIVTAMQYVLQS
jgi:Transcriptional regulator PadR-like family